MHRLTGLATKENKGLGMMIMMVVVATMGSRGQRSEASSRPTSSSLSSSPSCHPSWKEPIS